jgi:predicted nucleic acid-binding protein
MTLVDTSIWVDHLRGSIPHVLKSLKENAILVHPFAIGELAYSNLKPIAVAGSPAYAASRLASALFAECPLWTSDKALEQAAIKAGIYAVGHQHF